MEYKPLLSIKNFIILSFIVVISFGLFSILLSIQPLMRLFFSDITTPLIELMVIIILFYATIRSHGRFKNSMDANNGICYILYIRRYILGNPRAWISYQSISFHCRYFLPAILSPICTGIILPVKFFIQTQRKN